MRATYLLSALALLLAAISFTGCGDEEATSVRNPPPGETVTARVFEHPQKGIPADVGQWMVDIGVDPGGELAFTVAKVITPSGNTNFHLKNSQGVGHDLTVTEIGGESASTPVVREGTRWLRVPLFDGERYVFYCSVPGHREAGMEGTIEVDPQLTAEDLKPF
jgi:plastocyanin